MSKIIDYNNIITDFFEERKALLALVKGCFFAQKIGDHPRVWRALQVDKIQARGKNLISIGTRPIILQNEAEEYLQETGGEALKKANWCYEDRRLKPEFVELKNLYNFKNISQIKLKASRKRRKK